MSNKFMQKLLRENARQKELDLERATAVRLFADALAKARNEDAQELLAQARTSVAGKSDAGALRTLCELACSKLYNVGYQEFAALFKEALERGLI